MKTKVITEKIVEKAHAEATKIAYKERGEVLRDIRKILMECETTTTDDVIAETTREKLENPIYTKKLVFNVSREDVIKSPYTMVQIQNIKSVSMSCDSEDFSTCLNSDVRLNVKNEYNEWANTYLTTLSSYFLRFLLCLMREATAKGSEKKKLYKRFSVFADLASKSDVEAFIKDPDKFEEALDLLDDATS